MDLLKALLNLGMWLPELNLMQEKQPTIRYFWEGVQEAFEGQDEAYDNLHFADDEVLSELQHIDFEKNSIS